MAVSGRVAVVDANVLYSIELTDLSSHPLGPDCCVSGGWTGSVGAVGSSPSATGVAILMSVNNFFGEGSPYLGHPLLTAERTERELDELLALVGTLDVEVLDVGCGFGRHAVAMAARGARVTAIDPSGPMIQAARERADVTGQRVDFAQTDAVGLDVHESFDLVISLFTSFGQLASADGGGRLVHAGVMTAMYRALRPGGRLLIEVPDRHRAVAAMAASEQLGPTQVTRRFDAATSVICEQFATQTGATYDLFYEVFSADELVALAEGAGFTVVEVRDRGLVEPPMTMMTMLAQRPGVP